MPAGKPAPPRPRKPDAVIEGFLQCLETLVRDEVVERQGFCEAATPERPALLPDEVVDLGDRAEPPGVLTAVEKVRVEQRGDVAGLDIAVRDSCIALLHLDERFEPAGTPGAVAHELDVGAALLRLARDLECDLVSADGHSRRLAWHENLDTAHDCAALAAASRASNRSRLTRPWVLPFTMTAGAQAQLPRQ